MAPGGFCREAVVAYDLWPTLHDLAGGGTAWPDTIDGGSLRNVLHGGGQGTVERPLPGVVFHRPRHAQSAIRSGDLKLFFNWKSGRGELFDLSGDLGEAKDLAGEMPDQAGALESLLMDYLQAVDAERFPFVYER